MEEVRNPGGKLGSPPPIAAEVLDLLVRLNKEGSNVDGLESLGATLPALLPDDATADAVFRALVESPPEQLGFQDLSLFACIVRGMCAPEGRQRQAFVAAVNSLPPERRLAVVETLREGVSSGSTGLDEAPGMMKWLRQGVRQVVEEADAEVADALASGDAARGAASMPKATPESGLPRKPQSERNCRECSDGCVIA